MTYLSRIRINPLRTHSHTLLASPRALHAAVLGALPDPTTGPDGQRTLWRLDADNPHRPQLLALTPTRPDWTHLVEHAGWPDAEGDHTTVRDYTPLLTRLRDGDHYAFRLTANPVQNTTTPLKPSPTQTRRTTDGDRRSFRLGHRTADQQLGWLLQRTTGWGFDIPHARTDPPAPGLTRRGTAHQPSPAHEVKITERRRHSFPHGQRTPVVLHTATFEGRLRITDTHLLTRALLTGLGPAKAYGCGLLTLAPLPASGPTRR